MALRTAPRPVFRLLMRLALLGAVLAASLLYILHRLQGFDGTAVMAGLSDLTLWRVAAALLAVVAAFVAVAGQERAIVAWFGLSLPPGQAGFAAAAAAAVSQTVGFGPVVGALVRRRLMPEVTLGQSFAISAGITLGFFAGLGFLTLIVFAAAPGMPQQTLAQGLLAALLIGMVLLTILRMPHVLGSFQPNLFILGRFLIWLAIDLGALAVALWVVLPPLTAPAFWAMLPVFLIALGVGIASGSPGGIGPFEATLLAWLPQVDEAGLVAGILAFRALAYAVPALCGAIWALARPGLTIAATGPRCEVTETRHMPAQTLLRLTSAEAQLIRQGGLTLLTLGGGRMWLSGKLAHTRVVMGHLMAATCAGPVPANVLDVLERLAKAEARMLCLYKVDARIAVVSRSRGYVVLPVAREAVLDPASFHLSGGARARLRRKLAHALKAGVMVEDCANPPLAEMEAVAAEWCGAHGRERGFSMGRWERTYAAGQRVITARSGEGKLIAFVTFHAGQTNWVLDLVRFRPGAPDGTIYAMITHALEMARWLEVPEVSLAAVPDPSFGMTGPVSQLLQRLTRGSVGLAQFKSAFAPRWRTLYVAAPSRLALLIGGLELARAILRPAALPRGKKALILLGRSEVWADDAEPPSTERAA